MFNYNKFLFVVVILLQCSFNYGKAITIEDSFENITLPVAETPSATQIEFPAIKKKEGYSVCLSFKAYIDLRKWGGFNNYLALELNGRSLGKETEGALPRLLKRGSFVRTSLSKYPTKDWWNVTGGKPSLLMFFSTGQGEIDKSVLTSRNEGYNYVLDISDAVNYIVYGADFKIDIAKPNILNMQNMLLKKHVPNYNRKGLVIEEIKVLYLPDTTINKWRDVSINEFTEGNRVASLENKDFSLDVTNTGGMTVSIEGEKYFIESKFSYPHIPQMRYNLLGLSSGNGQVDWKAEVTQISNNEIGVQATNPNYTVSRKIKLTQNRIEVSDTVNNTSGVPIGIKFTNDVGINSLPKSDDYYLGGMRGAEAKNFAFSSSNPTIFINQQKSSIGLVAEDTIYRVQLSLLRKNNRFSLANSNFGLKEKARHTFDWAIYPVKDINYYTFINKVRRDWNVNFTIPGPFLGVTGWRHRNYICPGMKASLISFSPWFDWPYDRKIFNRAEYLEIVDKKIAPLRDKFPKAKFIPKLETNLVCLDITSFSGGDKLPVRKGPRTDSGIKYGLPLNKELSDLIVKNTPYVDSIIRDKDGRVLVDNFYPAYPNIDLMVQVEYNNYRYKVFLEQIDFLLNKHEFDGIYADQFIPMSVGGRSYDKWDGYSVELNDAGEIINKYYDYAITGVSGRVGITKKILEKGKPFIHNGQSISRELQSLKAIAFQEMENDNVDPLPFMDSKPPAFKWQAACHLGTPVILGLRTILYAKGENKDRAAEILNKGVITALRNGVLFYHYVSVIPTSGPHAGGYGPINHMFPFTPVEINEGFMVGEERTISCVSREFKVNFKKRPVCLLFDKKGLPKKHDFEISGSAGNWIVNVRLNDWCEIAIIEE